MNKSSKPNDGTEQLCLEFQVSVDDSSDSDVSDLEEEHVVHENPFGLTDERLDELYGPGPDDYHTNIRWLREQERRERQENRTTQIHEAKPFIHYEKPEEIDWDLMESTLRRINKRLPSGRKTKKALLAALNEIKNIGEENGYHIGRFSHLCVAELNSFFREVYEDIPARTKEYGLKGHLFV